MKKGSYGYIKNKRKKLMLWLILDIAVAVGIFVLGLFLNKFSNKNVFTVLAMLFTLPGAKLLVSLIVVFSYKGFKKEVYDKVSQITNNSETVLYDLVLTSPERVMYIKSMAIIEDEYVIVPDDKMLKAKDSKAYIEHMKRYIGKHMSNYGFEKEIVIIEDEDKYIDKLGKIFVNKNKENGQELIKDNTYNVNEEANKEDVEIANEEGKLNKIVNTLLILQV